MEDFIIDVTLIEEWQTIRDIPALDLLFEKAKRHITGGGDVGLVRSRPDGSVARFDTISTAADLAAYRDGVYKYL
ncbi:hypothetical protein [Deminuibacter soli]|uniref:Uncharacterized protein n=1 Tax=Deminuibacter soli TaxID=2291815 RepID=A0A3E1NLA9_9BACT|nr:hypothetical protein [Deminuibacter soli]RFM28707.1 hypothetical protein DXN05_07940 [Deminuibacter soli]